VRKRIVAGNWKMNKDHREGALLAEQILERLGGRKTDCEIVLIPPFTTLPAVMEVIGGSTVKGGAQDIFFEQAGAYTGAVSGPMLKALGVTYALVGHSERRHIFGDGDDLVARKLRAALKADLTPVLCVGEVLDERESGRASEVVLSQIRAALEGLSPRECSNVVVAYEPVWAIGTGKTATPQDASEIHGLVRANLEQMFGKGISSNIAILYGGSVKPSSAAELLSAPDVDGVLVGGASLDADSFLGIVFPP
jgi:triosephosphate isomerase